MNFQKKVLNSLWLIPKGKVTTYKQIAQKINSPRAFRAVGTALHKNPNPIFVPCHRVVKSDRSIGSYAFGVNKKRKLLEEEGVVFDEDGRVSDACILL